MCLAKTDGYPNTFSPIASCCPLFLFTPLASFLVCFCSTTSSSHARENPPGAPRLRLLLLPLHLLFFFFCSMICLEIIKILEHNTIGSSSTSSSSLVPFPPSKPVFTFTACCGCGFFRLTVTCCCCCCCCCYYSSFLVLHGKKKIETFCGNEEKRLELPLD